MVPSRALGMPDGRVFTVLPAALARPEAGATATATNFGTIASSGAGGSAVAFNSSTDVLIVEAGSAFVGAVTGDGGTLELASGMGSLAIRLAEGKVSVSGSMASTTFREFGVLKIEAGAQFTGSGAVSIAGGQVLNDAGALLLRATGRAGIGNAGLIETTGSGLLTLDGAVLNTGTVRAGGGTITITGAVSGGGVLATARWRPLLRVLQPSARMLIPCGHMPSVSGERTSTRVGMGRTPSPATRRRADLSDDPPLRTR